MSVWNPFVACFFPTDPVGVTESNEESHKSESANNDANSTTTTHQPVEPHTHHHDGHDTPGHKRTFYEVYELGEKLGEGGYAVVKKATHLHNKDQRAVAVKIVTRENLKEKDEIALKKEYQILKTIHHPNIVHAFEFFEDEKFFYVVMEYLEGGELFDRIVKKTQYNEAEAREVVILLLKSIKYCHDHDVVHRDLKPENLLLTSPDDDANLKLADFGLALLLAHEEAITVPKAGTPDYIAPEVIENQPVGKPIDMWSFGVIMFILLGGYPPFHDTNQRVLFSKICRAQFAFHPKRWSNVSEEAKDMIRGLLTVDPHKRLTAEQALQHTWVTKEAHLLEANNLDTNLAELKRFNARRRLRGGIKAVMAANQFLKTTSSKKLVAAGAPAAASAEEEGGYDFSSDEEGEHSVSPLAAADVEVSLEDAAQVDEARPAL